MLSFKIKLMHKLRKLIKSFSNCLKDIKEFGFTIAISSFIWPYLKFIPRYYSKRLMQAKHSKVIYYLSNKYKFLLQNFHFEKETLPDFNGAIWVCWLQGEINMPPTVLTCIQALKHHANEHPVIIISFNNFQKYITLPDYIINKYQSGNIGNAHFADILRTCLLYEHGGVWIDSTLLTIQALPKEIFIMPFYSCKFNVDSLYITQCKWSNFFLCSQKKSKVFAFTRAFFFEYIKKENRFIDYFLMDYIIHLGYKSYLEIKEEIDQVPINNIYVHSLAPIINKSYNVDIWNKLIQNTYLFKLSWKTNYIEKSNKKLSYWGFIKQHII